MKIWLNGKLVDEEKAQVSIFDRSYLYGEGIFETLKCYGGKPAFLPQHFRRFNENCKKLSLSLPLSEKELGAAIDELVLANDLKEAAVRITLSTVGATFGVKKPDKTVFNISIFSQPVSLDPKLFETGVKVLPLRTLINDSLQTANIKSTSYLTKMLARSEANNAGAYESILKNGQGFWVEGSRTNFFIVLDQVVITAPVSDGILSGITREVVLEILKNQKIPHREDHITDLMLQNAQEVFLTGSTSEVMPVCELTGLAHKTVSKNSLTLKLQKEYLSLVI